MSRTQAEGLRKAIENLINAKLRDLVRPGGVDRLVAHRATGVAAYEIRDAEKRLDQALAELIPSKSPSRRARAGAAASRNGSISSRLSDEVAGRRRKVASAPGRDKASTGSKGNTVASFGR